MKHARLSVGSLFLVVVAVLAMGGTGAAQTPATTAASAPAATATTTTATTTAATPAAPEPASAPPAAEPPPESGTAALLMPQASTACFPSCRKGFLCRAGECVSQCNPPCGAGEMCTEQSECVMREPAVPPPDPTAEKHDGFYLHLAAGIGGGGAERETTAGKVKYSGGVGMFSVDVGAAVAEDLVLFGRVSDFSLSDPTIEIDGTKVSSTNDDGLTLGMLGAGVGYYFMPINLFVSGTVGLATASTDAKHDNRSKTGFGFNLDVGKEWWVSDQWGLGVALRLSTANVPPNETWGAPNKHLRAGALGVLFSATYQ